MEDPALTVAPEAAAAPQAAPAADPAVLRRRRRFPTLAAVRAAARRRAPAFAFDYLDGGAGADGGIARNRAALDAVELVPRYGAARGRPALATELFGRRYAAPIGIAPMGCPSIALPGADLYLARAAEAAGMPYVLGTVGGATIEAAAAAAPNSLWFQAYPLPGDDHAVGLDLLARAEASGIHVLVLTMDCPVRTTRPREVLQGVVAPFRLTPGILAGIAGSPLWLAALLRNGRPRFASLERYLPGPAGIAAMAEFSRREVRGAFTWPEVARYRERWRGALVVKGLLHPADAERALALGADGIWVSNHGGRQVEGLPAAIDTLPAIATAVDGRATLLLDSGIQSGLDVVRALRLGAQAAFAGKAFLWGLAGLGAEGPAHVLDLLQEETAAVLQQLGAGSTAGLAGIAVRHRGAFDFSAA